MEALHPYTGVKLQDGLGAGWVRAGCGLEAAEDAGCHIRVATKHWQRGRAQYK